jgi:hypothetical protein
MYKEVLNKMIQMATEQMKAISDRQMDAIKRIIQSRNFTLQEYKKLKEVLAGRVITRRDASTFLEYCYAKVSFERSFNGHRHQGYAGCCFCKSRDNLKRVENRRTGRRGWCCEACIGKGTDPSIVVVPKTRRGISGTQKRNELARIRGLATDIALTAGDCPAGVVPGELAEMAAEVAERASGLLAGRTEAVATMAAARLQSRDGRVGGVEEGWGG